MEGTQIPRPGDGSTPPAGASPRRLRPAGDHCPGGEYGSPYPYTRNGKIYGCCLPSKMGDMTMAEVAKALCWTGTAFVATAVAGGANVVFQYEVKYWWQIQEFLNLGEQVTRSFELTAIRYGQSDYDMLIKELRINGTLTAQQGVDVRHWNFEIYQRFFPIPACGLDDPVTLTFTNVTVGALDFNIGAMGPAVLQIG